MFYLCRKEEIPEWKQMYVRRERIYKILAALKSFPHIIESGDFKRYLNLHKYMWESIEIELEKVKSFLNFWVSKISYEYTYVRSILKKLYSNTHDKSKNTITLIRRALITIFHEARLAIIFSNTNKRRLLFMLKSFRKYSPPIFNFNSQDRLIAADKNVDMISEAVFREIRNLAEDQYNDLPEKDNKYELDTVKKEFICTPETLLKENIVKVMIWILLMSSLLILFSFYSQLVNQNPVDEDFKQIFPIYRGIFLFTIYFWLLVSNVFFFAYYEINYSLIFGFRSKTSLPHLILQVTYFTIISIFSFVAYTVHSVFSSTNDGDFTVMKRVYSAIPWSCLLVYLLLPTKKHFNWEGRKYFWNIWRNIILFWKESVDFRLIWFSDQLVSLVKPIQDLQYTLCFYFSLPDESQAECKNSNKFHVALLTISLVFLFRMLQEGKRVYDSGSIKHTSSFNFIKYLLGFTTAYISYFSSFYQPLFYVWAVVATISTIYSFLWDIFFDFGLGSILNMKGDLAYKDIRFYYTIFVVNFFLRFMWILNVSDEIIKQFTYFEFFSLIIGLLEIIRRILWNLIRVDYEQRKNVGNLSVVKEFPNTEKYFEIKVKERNHALESNTTEVQLIDIEKPISQEFPNLNISNEFASTKFDLDILDPEHIEDLNSDRLSKGIVMREEAYAQVIKLRNQSKVIYHKGQDLLSGLVNI